MATVLGVNPVLHDPGRIVFVDDPLDRCPSLAVTDVTGGVATPTAPPVSGGRGDG